MKGKIKKTIAAISAVMLCTIPMANGLSASAAGSQHTYRIYYDVQNTGIADLEISFSYSGDVVVEPSMKTSLCANGDFNSIHYPLSNKVVTTYKGNAITNTGALATTKILSSNTLEGIYNVLSFTSPTVKNADGNNMSPTSVNIDIVLVGDADSNGVISINDAVIIQSYASNPTKYSWVDVRAADVNGDGVVTNDDALLVQQYLAQIISHF